MDQQPSREVMKASPLYQSSCEQFEAYLEKFNRYSNNNKVLLLCLSHINVI